MPTELFENCVNFNPPLLLPANVDLYVCSTRQVTFITLVEIIRRSEEEIHLGSRANTKAQIDCFCFITILYFTKVNQIEESRGKESNLNWQVSQIT